MTNDNHTFFQDPEIKYPSYSPDLLFSDYINQCKTLIENTRTDLKDNSQAELIVSANTPFELIPEAKPAATRQGALLIHGLYDCPFVMREIGAALQSQGLLVRSVLLPGHGTRPSALLNVTYQEWLQTADYGIASLAKEVDSIILVGFSTGATIALNLVLKNKFSVISGMVLLAPAIKISVFAGWMNWPPKLNGLSPRLNWFNIADEVDYAKYCSFTCNSAYQLYLLIQENNRLSEKVKAISIPAFMVLTQQDQSVSSSAAIKYFMQYMSSQSKLLVYTKDKTMLDTRMILRPDVFPEWSAKNISHVAIPVSPANKHYGKNGDWKTFENKISRLLYNPDYELLQENILEFADVYVERHPTRT